MKKLTVIRKIGLIAVAMMLTMLMIVAAVAPAAATDEFTDVTYSSASLSIDGSISLKFYITDLGSLADSDEGYLAVRVPDATGAYATQKVTVDQLAKSGSSYPVLSDLRRCHADFANQYRYVSFVFACCERF